MNKVLAGIGAALGLGCMHSPGDSAIIYAENTSSQQPNGLTREERVLCHRDGGIELQLKYLNAEGRTQLFVSLDRRNGIYCTEAISIVDPTGIALDRDTTGMAPELAIMYDDHCNSTMDRFSRRPAGSRVENAMHYRSLWDAEAAEANDAEYGLLRSQIDEIFGIEAQVQACEERNQE